MSVEFIWLSFIWLRFICFHVAGPQAVIFTASCNLVPQAYASTFTTCEFVMPRTLVPQTLEGQSSGNAQATSSNAG